MSVIDDYLRGLEPTQRIELKRVRALAKQTVPDAGEVISYGMPVLQYKDKYLIGFSAFKRHMSIFPGSEAVEAHATELNGFKLLKGTVQFTADTPIPDKTLRSIIEHCKQRIDSGK